MAFRQRTQFDLRLQRPADRHKGELGVRYLLEGTVRKAGNRVRITAQLIEALNGAHLWADRFDGSLEDIFDLQDQVATSVAGVAGDLKGPMREIGAPASVRLWVLAPSTQSRDWPTAAKTARTLVRWWG
jgi:hypothetical protein